MTTDTTSATFFESKYQENSDPWNFSHSEYEHSRYASILKALGDRHYDHIFEPGCSIGELTSALAKHGRWVTAMDISPTAVSRAKQRCNHLSNVDIQMGQLSDNHLLSLKYDLIVFSEIGYYFDAVHLHQLMGQLADCLPLNGAFLAAHWLGTSEDHLLTGDQVHEIIGNVSLLCLEHSERHKDFRLDRWARV